MTRELPNNVPFQAKLTLITAAQSTWQASVQTSFEKVFEAMVRLLIGCLENHFRRHELLQSHLK